MIAFGGEIFDKEEEVTVAEYILGNIEEVLDDFDNKQYLSIVRECLDRVVSKKSLTPQHFIGHQNHQLSAMSIDLLHSPYEYSPGWEERELYLHSQKMPDENFSKDSISALMRFKLKKIIRLCEKNQQQLVDLKSEKDSRKIMRLLKVQSKLIEMRNDLAKELGTVVIK